MTILPTGLSRLVYQESDVYKRTRTQHAHLRSNSFFDGTVVNTPAVFASLLRQQMYTTFNHTSATKALLLSGCRSTAGIFECYDDNSIDEDHAWMDRVGVHRRKVVLVKDQFWWSGKEACLCFLPLFRAVLSLIHSEDQATHR